MRLKQRVAIITGGSRGIGKAIAEAFVKEGAFVTIVSRTEKELLRAKVEMEKIRPGHTMVVVADISKTGAAQRIVKLSKETYGKIDILINNAGVIGPMGPFIDNDINRWIETVNINLFGAMRMIKSCLPHMMAQRFGKIINLSGGGAVSPRPNFSAYGASKAALERFTETLAKELLSWRIDVNSIAPGAVNTKMTKEIVQNKEKAGKEEFLSAQKKSLEEVDENSAFSSLAVFLASYESNGLSGRLISAVWDDWENLNSRIKTIMTTDAFTVRRIKEEEARAR